MSQVIVTRPLAQAVPLAAQVEALGRRACIFPLLDIAALADQSALQAMVARLSEFALVAFVSPNAIAALLAYVPKWPVAVSIAIIGAGSRAALQKHGIDDSNANIISPRNAVRTDSETLLEELDATALRGRPVLIVRAAGGRELLANALRSCGAEVEQVLAYRRGASETATDGLARAR